MLTCEDCRECIGDRAGERRPAADAGRDVADDGLVCAADAVVALDTELRRSEGRDGVCRMDAGLACDDGENGILRRSGDEGCEFAVTAATPPAAGAC